jgi:hypothetical protein
MNSVVIRQMGYKLSATVVLMACLHDQLEVSAFAPNICEPVLPSYCCVFCIWTTNLYKFDIQFLFLSILSYA